LFFTSNSEKNLPDAFLRRCLYFHIPFPDPERLRRIIVARLPESHRLTGSAFDRALEHFLQIREFALRKKPSTAECLAWMMILAHLNINLDFPQRGDYEAMALSYAALAKNAEDLSFLRNQLDNR
jgi:MoxR-like ATPase